MGLGKCRFEQVWCNIEMLIISSTDKVLEQYKKVIEVVQVRCTIGG